MRDYAALERDTTPPRDDFRHMKPIDDLLLALHLLQRGWNDRTHRRLMTGLTNPSFYIEVMICNGGYTKDLHSRSEYYPVCEALVGQLRMERLVEGTPHWGYTDDNELTLSERGNKRCGELAEAFEEEVKAFLAAHHPDTPYTRITVYPRLLSMRFRHRQDLDDFFVSLHINSERDEVRRTRGVLSLVRAERQNAA